MIIRAWMLYWSSILLNSYSLVFNEHNTLNYSTAIILAFMLMCTGIVLHKLEQAE